MFFLSGVWQRTSATWLSSNTRRSSTIWMVSVTVCFKDDTTGYIMIYFNNLNDLWWGYFGTASPRQDTGCQCFTMFLAWVFYSGWNWECNEQITQKWSSRICVCVWGRDRQGERHMSVGLKEKISEKQISCREEGTDSGSDIFVRQRNALILCLLHLLLRFGQHPKLMVIIIAVTLHRLCWCSREGAVWHQLHKHWSCLTKHAFSYGSEMSRVTPINRGQKNTEGLWCWPGREKVASTWPIVFL